MSATKCALVLGNSAYSEKLLLRSPKNDAESVASALKGIDFHVTLGVDLTYEKMSALIDEYVKSLDAAHNNVTLFYYSGHGLQIQEKNFLVPIDFDDVSAIKLIPVQDVIDKVSEFSALQIVLLDACRSNFDAGSILQSKAIYVEPEKAIYVGGTSEPVSGLAEMRAAASTFIAFAAAPGDVAYDGGGTLSPFTDAFLKYVDVVDLPLSNLMSRVRQEVLEPMGGNGPGTSHL